MLECKHKGVLSLNLKKLANRVDDLKKNLLFTKWNVTIDVFFCKQCSQAKGKFGEHKHVQKRVLKQKEELVNTQVSHL